MAKEQLEKDYYADRPPEPYCDDESPNDWANLAHYAEENLEKAFERIEELEQKNAKLKGDADSVFDNWCKGDDPCPHLKKRDNQLTKAKEILQTVLDKWKEERWILQSEKEVRMIERLMKQAEQFLSDSKRSVHSPVNSPSRG